MGPRFPVGVAVALVDDGIVAAAKTHLQADPDGEVPAGHYLGGVSVHPDYRRRGIGLALTSARVDWVWTRSDTVYYFTDDDSTASMRLHAGFGFREIARWPTILGARAHRESEIIYAQLDGVSGAFVRGARRTHASTGGRRGTPRGAQR